MEIPLIVNNMDKNNNKVNVGDLVFAKLKGYPPWPAHITEKDKNKYKVIFFGSGEFANLHQTYLFPYSLNKDKFVTEKNLKYRGFQKAVEEIEAVQHEKDSTVSDVLVSRAASNDILEGASFADNSGNNERNMGVDESISQGSSSNNEMQDDEDSLLIERNLIALCGNVHSCLGLRVAYMNRALKALQQIKTLKVTPVMLLRNPGCVRVIRRVRNYVGNFQAWSLTDEQKADAAADAALIRSEAAVIYEKLRELFLVLPEINFWIEFEKRVIQFRIENGININEETNVNNQSTQNGLRIVDDAEEEY